MLDGSVVNFYVYFGHRAIVTFSQFSGKTYERICCNLSLFKRDWLDIKYFEKMLLFYITSMNYGSNVLLNNIKFRYINVIMALNTTAFKCIVCSEIDVVLQNEFSAIGIMMGRKNHQKDKNKSIFWLE